MLATEKPAPKRPDASMTLLTEVMERPLDPSYAVAAARRAAARRGDDDAPRRGWSVPVVLLLAIALGATTAISASHLYSPFGGTRETRAIVENQIRTRTSEITYRTAQIGELTNQITILQEVALTANDPQLATALQTDEVRNGRVPVSGPGLVITLTDGGGGLMEVTSDHLVRDVDLQNVVSALWAAGAEAIAVGEQRLTMTTAIRNAGDAVLIDLVPVLGPTFQITAIGNPTEMEARWRNSGAPEYLAMLGTEFGIRSTTTVYANLTVPGATPPVLRFAAPLPLELDSDGPEIGGPQIIENVYVEATGG